MDEIGSIIFYFVMFGLSALLLHIGLKKHSKFYVGLSLIIPILISGLRHNVGTDYITYVELFHAINSYTFTEFIETFERLEVGFVGLNKLAYLISSSPTMLFFLSSSIVVIFFFLGLSRYEVKYKALLFFIFLVTIFPITFNIVRQGIAMAIAFYAITFILSRQPIRFALWVYISSLFHVTALLLLPLYLLNVIIKKNMVKSYYRIGAIVAISSAVLIILLPEIINVITGIDAFERYAVYLNSEQASSPYLMFIKILIIGIVAIFYKRIIAVNPANIYYFIFAIIDLVISTIGFSSYELYRITYYFSFFNIFLLISIIDIFKSGTQARILTTGIILYSILYFLYAYYSLGSNSILPYSWQV